MPRRGPGRWALRPAHLPAQGDPLIPDRNNRVRVSANFAGEVELTCSVGQLVHAGQCLVEIEGQGQIERLCAKQRARVVELAVEQDAVVDKHQLLVVIELLPDKD